MKYSGHRKLLCELSNLSKFNAFNLPGFLTNIDATILVYKFRTENWFQYVRRVYANAINFPCIITLTYPVSLKKKKNIFLPPAKKIVNLVFKMGHALNVYRQYIFLNISDKQNIQFFPFSSIFYSLFIEAQLGSISQPSIYLSNYPCIYLYYLTIHPFIYKYNYPSFIYLSNFPCIYLSSYINKYIKNDLL